MNVRASELTRLLAITAVALKPVASISALACESTSFETVAVIDASFDAFSVTSPATLTTASEIHARARACCSRPMSVPSSASIVLNRTFCACHPTVLKARTTPSPVSPVIVAALTVASITDAF